MVSKNGRQGAELLAAARRNFIVSGRTPLHFARLYRAKRRRSREGKKTTTAAHHATPPTRRRQVVSRRLHPSHHHDEFRSTYGERTAGGRRRADHCFFGRCTF